MCTAVPFVKHAPYNVTVPICIVDYLDQAGMYSYIKYVVYSLVSYNTGDYTIQHGL